MQFQSGAVSPVGSIQDGWNLIKPNYWTYFAMTLVAFIILIGVSLVFGLINNGITFVISGALGVTMQDSSDIGKISASIVPQLISVIISFFTNIVVSAISGVLFCGIFKGLSRQANSGVSDFSDLFSGFQHFQACLIVGAILSLVQLIIGLVTLLGGAAAGVSVLGAGILTKDGQLNPAIFGSLFLVILLFVLFSLIINLIVYVLTCFVYPLIGTRSLSAGQALMLSIKSAFANFFGLLGLVILSFLMAIGGVLVCFVGILFVAPIIYAALFAAFQNVFGKVQDSYQYSPPPPPNFGNQPGY